MAGKELNEKQEKFAQAYVLYNNATEAAKAAGYSAASAANQGHRLANDPKIRERIENLQKEMETRIDVIKEVEEQYKISKDNQHTQSALKALELLARVRAPQEQGSPATIEELEADIVRCLEVLGEDRATKLLLRCSWFNEDRLEGEKDDDLEDEYDPIKEREEDLDDLPPSAKLNEGSEDD